MALPESFLVSICDNDTDIDVDVDTDIDIQRRNSSFLILIHVSK